jgi:hypothetical protein
LSIPPYFHSSRVSLATASAVSGASIGMFGIPFLLQFLFNTYGLRGATLLGSCLWLSVALAGALFGKGVTSIEEENSEILADESVVGRTESEGEQPITTPRRSITSNNGLIYSRRTSLLPISTYQQQHKRFSSFYQQHQNTDRLMANMPTIYEGLITNHRGRSPRYVENVISTIFNNPFRTEYLFLVL